MKKILFISAIIFICVKAVYSQENFPFRIGVDIASGLAWIKPNSSNITSDGSKFGFQYGLMGDYYLTSFYAITSGIDVMYNGGKIQYNNLTPVLR